MPSVVMPADTTTPRVARVSTTGRSLRREGQAMKIAASKIRGGRKALKISSRVRAMSGAKGSQASRMPPSTRPTL